MKREWKCLDHSGITKQSRLIRGLKDNILAVKFSRPLLNNEPQVRSVDKRSLLSLHQSEKIVIIISEKNEADWTESTPRGTPTIVEIHPMFVKELIREWYFKSDFLNDISNHPRVVNKIKVLLDEDRVF
ncbi:hypothetical protein V1477_018773 [Vespula maculifrons]|uniref:Uncharacterized protein n=1 Tax=Vespula maculifrons TaxID=7453 RepID=A0ABD2AX74_VESMC